MCYTVQVETSSCRFGHTTGIQVCWRRCPETVTFTKPMDHPLPGHSYRGRAPKDWYNLCDHVDPERMVEITMPHGYVANGDCEVCKAISPKDLLTFEENKAQDDIVRQMRERIRTDEARFIPIDTRLRELTAIRTALDKDRALHPVTSETDSKREDLDEGIDYCNSAIQEIQKSISDSERLIQERTKDLADAVKAKLAQDSVEAFMTAYAWPWRYYGDPGEWEKSVMGEECAVELKKTQDEMLRSRGVINGLCNWDETPIHEMY